MTSRGGGRYEDADALNAEQVGRRRVRVRVRVTR
jgi:hypothetical protein